MKKLKEIWDKLKYWQRGAIIGLLFGILYQFFISFLDRVNFKIYGYLGFESLHLIPLVLFGGTKYIQILIVIWYGIIGTFLGLIYKILIDKTKKNTLRFLILVIIILIVILYIIDLKILGLMFTGLG